jgi:hypothetical protein
MQVGEESGAGGALLGVYARLQALLQRCLEGEPLVLEAWLAYQVTSSLLASLQAPPCGRLEVTGNGESRAMTPTEASRNRGRSQPRPEVVHAVYEDTAGGGSAFAPRRPPPLLERRLQASASRAAARGGSARGGQPGGRAQQGGVPAGQHVVCDAPDAVDRILDLQRAARAVVDNVTL